DELAFREAMARPDPCWQLEQADRCEREHQWFAAAFHLGQALHCRPQRSLYRRRGHAWAEQGRWGEAQADYAEAAGQDMSDPEAWRLLALVELALGHEEAHHRACTSLLDRFDRPLPSLAALPFGAAPGEPLGQSALILAAAGALRDRAAAGGLLARACVLRPT